MEYIVHRCRGFGHKENSVRAIRAALQSDIDGIEIDIRLTKDRKWVAIHDPFYKDEKRTIKRIHEHRLSELRREVISLDEILALHAAMGKGRPIFIDVKDVGATRSLVKMIRMHGLKGEVVIIAWEPEVLKRVHKEDPEIRLGLSYVPIHETLKGVKMSVNREISRQKYLLRFNELHSFDTKFRIGKTHQHYLSELPDIPLYSIQVFALFCSAKLVKRAHERGLKVMAFTVNRSITSKLLERRSVDIALTDSPKTFI